MKVEGIDDQGDMNIPAQVSIRKRCSFIFLFIIFFLSVCITFWGYYFFVKKTDQVPVVIEAEAPKTEVSIDTDLDGLIDNLELKIGTDSARTDTDNDGYSDYEEFSQGYNPNGEGILGDLKKIDDKEDFTESGAQKKIDLSRLLANEIAVDWYESPIRADLKNFFDAETVKGAFLKANPYSEGDNLDSLLEYFYEVALVYEAGVIMNGAYGGGTLNLMYLGEDLESSFFRVIKKNNMISYLSDADIDRQIWHINLFEKGEDLKIYDLEPVDRVEYVRDGRNMTLIKESTSFGKLMIDQNAAKQVFQDGETKILLEKGTNCFLSLAKDGSTRHYNYELPFAKKKEDAEPRSPRHFEIEWLDAKSKQTDFYANTFCYVDAVFSCNRFATYISDSKQLEVVGKTTGNDPIYALADLNIKRKDNSKSSVLREVYDVHQIAEKKISYEDFLANRPLIFWQDPLGNYVEFLNADYLPRTQCIYR
jgi:hypothetical protein